VKPEFTILNLVLILTGGYGFPVGDAYTNRVLAFANGFIKNGCKVTLLIIYPGRNNQAEKHGSIDGFDYYFCTSLKWPDNPLQKKITGFTGIVNAISLLSKIHNQNPIDAVLTFSQKFSQNFPVYLFTRFKKVTFIRENNEFPRIVLKRGNSSLNFYEILYFSLVNRLYDGYIYISKALVEFNRPFIGENMPVIIVPIIVDNERFDMQHIGHEKQITYCGNLFGDKDGVKILISAFARIHKIFPDYILRLIGDISNKTEYANLVDFAEEKGILSKIEFTGFVHRTIIPALLKQSSLLVLARPDNIQAKGGFPTKLGEYLATGRPVLVTSVGDIPDYIHDGVNGFLAKPGSVEDFAEKLILVLSNYSKSERIGIKGKKLTQKDFDNVFQSGRVMEFVQKLDNKLP